MTEAERKLWYLLRNRRFADVKFKRQVPLGRYVADFLSFEKRILVEVDGGQHADSASDRTRDAWFRGQGFAVVRFWNSDVLTNPEGVLASLSEVIEGAPPHPAAQPRAAELPPSPARGEGKKPASRSRSAKSGRGFGP